MRMIIIIAILLSSLGAASATTYGSHRWAHSHHRDVARECDLERHGYRYWDGPLSDEGTRYYGENGGTVHYGY